MTAYDNRTEPRIKIDIGWVAFIGISYWFPKFEQNKTKQNQTEQNRNKELVYCFSEIDRFHCIG